MSKRRYQSAMGVALSQCVVKVSHGDVGWSRGRPYANVRRWAISYARRRVSPNAAFARVAPVKQHRVATYVRA